MDQYRRKVQLARGLRITGHARQHGQNKDDFLFAPMYFLTNVINQKKIPNKYNGFFSTNTMYFPLSHTSKLY
jgi:hypothetical protein